jgi:hypothetical protein
VTVLLLLAPLRAWLWWWSARCCCPTAPLERWEAPGGGYRGWLALLLPGVELPAHRGCGRSGRTRAAGSTLIAVAAFRGPRRYRADGQVRGTSVKPGQPRCVQAVPSR